MAYAINRTGSASDNGAQRVLITLYDIRTFQKRYSLLNLSQIQRERGSTVEYKFSGYFGQFVPKRPLWRGENFKM
jgi:hypothetical protein